MICSRGRHDQLDLLVEHELQLVDDRQVVGVGGDDPQGLLGAVERNDLVFAGDRFRHHLNDRLRDLGFVEVHEVEAVLFGDGPHHVFRGGVTQLDEGVLQLDAARRAVLCRFFLLGGVDFALLDEDVREIPTRRLGHGNGPR